MDSLKRVISHWVADRDKLYPCLALYRHGVGTVPASMNGNHKIGAAHRLLEHISVNQEEGGKSRKNGWLKGESSTVMGRSIVKGVIRGKKFGRAMKNRKCAFGFLVIVLLCGILFILLASYYLSAVGLAFTGEQDSSSSNYFFDRQGRSRAADHHSLTESLQDEQHHGTSGFQKKTSTDMVRMMNRKTSFERDIVFNNVKHNSKENTRSKVHFGLAVDERIGHRDSRDWDSDDRKRVPVASNFKERGSHSKNGKNNLLQHTWMEQLQSVEKDGLGNSQDMKESDKGDKNAQLDDGNHNTQQSKAEDGEGKIGRFRVEDLRVENLGLYNERGRKELRKYEQQFEADLKLDQEYNFQMDSKDTLQGDDLDDALVDNETSGDDTDGVEGESGSKVTPDLSGKYRSTRGDYNMLPEKQLMVKLHDQEENPQEHGS